MDYISDPHLLRGKAVIRFKRALEQAQADNNPTIPLTLFNRCLADEHCTAHDICSVSDHDRVVVRENV